MVQRQEYRWHADYHDDYDLVMIKTNHCRPSKTGRSDGAIICHFFIHLQTVDPYGVSKVNPVRDALIVENQSFHIKQPHRGGRCPETPVNISFDALNDILIGQHCEILPLYGNFGNLLQSGLRFSMKAFFPSLASSLR